MKSSLILSEFWERGFGPFFFFLNHLHAFGVCDFKSPLHPHLFPDCFFLKCLFKLFILSTNFDDKILQLLSVLLTRGIWFLEFVKA